MAGGGQTLVAGGGQTLVGIMAPTDYRTGGRAGNILEEKPVTGLKNTGVIMGENTGVDQLIGG